jgi:hypothetical protein
LPAPLFIQVARSGYGPETILRATRTPKRLSHVPLRGQIVKTQGLAGLYVTQGYHNLALAIDSQVWLTGVIDQGPQMPFGLQMFIRAQLNGVLAWRRNPLPFQCEDRFSYGKAADRLQTLATEFLYKRHDSTPRFK